MRRSLTQTPLFKLALYRKIDGVDETLEELLEDPHSELFINIFGIVKITAIFREGEQLKTVYKNYIKSLHNMQAMDLEMPEGERPTTLKKLVKRFFTKMEFPFGTGPTCSGCNVPPKLVQRQMTHFPRYLTIMLNREARIGGVRAYSKRICEIPMTGTTKILG